MSWLAVGMNADALNGVLDELHKTYPDLFKGQEGSGEDAVIWDVAGAPTVKVGPPDKKDWDSSVDAQGNTPPAAPMPDQGVLQVTLVDTSARVGTSTKNIIDGQNIEVYLQVSAAGGKIGVVPLAMRTDCLSGWDQEAVDELMSKVLRVATGALGGITIPVIEPFGTRISFTDYAVETTSTHLVLTAEAHVSPGTGAEPQADRRPATAGLGDYPTDGLWLLIGRNLAGDFLRVAVNHTQEVAWGRLTEYETSVQGHDVRVEYVVLPDGITLGDDPRSASLAVNVPKLDFYIDDGLLKMEMDPPYATATAEITDVTATDLHYKVARISPFLWHWEPMGLYKPLVIDYLNRHCQGDAWKWACDQWVGQKRTIPLGTGLDYTFEAGGTEVTVRVSPDGIDNHNGMLLVKAEAHIH
ncbi:hypothetical protein ACFRAR_04295 [Kitasatospora sp. NPDC056651]|uniref:hypothetical protein n=1 Tax=Kitasatospora sp. NPDC056651 TaxID=3345892 RepID=UPI003675E466